MSRSWLLIAAALLLAQATRAQELLQLLGPEPATLRLGDTARAELRITDPQGTPREPQLPEVDGLQLRLGGPSRQSEQRWDGRQLIQRTTVSWLVELRPLREGAFALPPFPVWTGSKEQTTRELRLEARRDLRGEELGWLEVRVAPTRVYVHEPIRVQVEAGVQQGLRLVQGRANNGQPFFDVEVQASWLEDFPGGERLDGPAPAGEQALIVRGGNSLMPVAYDPDHRRAGEAWQRFAFERTFLPTRIGRIELPAPMLRYHVVRREGRTDVFGLARGGQTEQFFVTGRPLQLEVVPIPEAGRPTPFYGAVGRFTLTAEIDRDTVRVGSSVKLTLTVRGQGNLEFLRLPPLDQLPGLHKLGETEPRRDADKVAVTYDLTPLSVDVREVPAIEWNFFDTTPGIERFVRVATPPQPLRVEALPAGEALAPLPESAPKAVTPGIDDIFDLPPLDGAVVLVSAPAPWLPWAAALGPWLLAAGALAWSRRRRARAADVAGQRARAAGRCCLRTLDDGGDPFAALAEYLGGRLGVPAASVIAPDLLDRLRRAGLDPALAIEVEAAVERGTAARYGGGGSALGADAVRTLVQRLDRQRFGVAGWLPWLLPLLLVAAPPAPLRAQDVAAGVAAYRAGDHAAAEAAFARAYAATGDRRLLWAIGNCAFRRDDLPRALWAYESARLGLPRAPELRANVALVRRRLQLDDDVGFLAEVQALRARLSAGEQSFLTAALMALAAGCLVLGWRRPGLRWVGLLAAAPGAWLLLDLAWWRPSRAPAAVALQPLRLVAEPRADLDPVASVRAGVVVELLGGGEGAFVRVRAGDRVGYAARDAVAVLR